MTRIEIVTGSRLHFGLICGTQNTGWEFGGVGLMLRQPSWTIVLVPHNEVDDRITASAETSGRVQKFLRQIRSTLPLKSVAVSISEEIPFHTGLGSGTQLGLALAAAAVLLTSSRPNHDPDELARLAHRAERSAVGTVGFREGGFLIDHGASANPPLRHRVDRLAIPEDWRFVLVRPVQAQGLCGDTERDFFSQHIHMPKSLVGQLGEQIEHQLVPAVRDGRFDEFASALEAYGRTIGSFYAQEQGDVFAHPVIRRLVTDMQSSGIQGAAQSSWGPGICIPARSMSHARMISEMIPASLEETALAVQISEPLNVGASLRSTSAEPSRGQLA